MMLLAESGLARGASKTRTSYEVLLVTTVTLNAFTRLSMAPRKEI